MDGYQISVGLVRQGMVPTEQKTNKKTSFEVTVNGRPSFHGADEGGLNAVPARPIQREIWN